MKKLTFFLFLFTLTLTSCTPERGIKDIELHNTSNLPLELDGLKVYRVYYDDGGSMEIALLPNTTSLPISYSEQRGKYVVSRNVTLITPNQNLVLEGEIISETDSIIVIKKSKP